MSLTKTEPLMDIEPNFDLANNTELKKLIIQTVQTIVDIENNSPSGNKPALAELKALLIETYGIIKMSLYALANN